MIPATMDTTIEAAAHLDNQIEARDTGFEATHERVPLSRSPMSRLIAAKIATITKICDEIAPKKFTIGSSEIGPSETSPSGTLATSQVVIAPLAAVRAMNAVVVARMTQMRLLWAHSRSSLRNSGPKPASRSAGTRPVTRAGTEIEAVMLHAPWC